MLRNNASTLALIAILLLIAACDQKPIDLGPESTGMEWTRVVEFDSESSYDTPDVWASSPSDVYAWSRFTEPRLQHFDGSAWAAVSFQPNSIYYVDVWGSGPSDVYVTDATLRHFDGASWTDTGIAANQISGSSSSNVFISSDGIVLHFNGAAWDTLLHKEPSRQIRDIAAYGANGAFFAARDSLLQWEDNQWNAYKAPALADRVVVFPDKSCVVATYDNGESVFFHFANGLWTSFADPVNSAFIDDMCIGAGVVWVAADDRLHRYDGNAWSPVAVPTNHDLYGVWGNDDDVYAVGGGGVAIQFSADWQIIRSGIPGRPYSLYATSSHDIMIGGGVGTVYRFASGNWLEQPLPGESRAVTCLSGTTADVFAGTESGRVYQLDGDSWTLSADSLGGSDYARVADICACADGTAFAVGQGFIARFDGTAWKRSLSTDDVISYVWALDGSTAFATNYRGVLEFDGKTWKSTELRATLYAEGVWGTSRNNVYIAAGDILHYDGQTWRNVLPGGSYGHITGRTDHDVVAISEFEVGHFDGEMWKEDWVAERRDQPIDLVTARSGEIFAMYSHYSRETGSYYVSRRVAP